MHAWLGSQALLLGKLDQAPPQARVWEQQGFDCPHWLSVLGAFSVYCDFKFSEYYGFHR
jgi:hypothetical protein